MYDAIRQLIRENRVAAALDAMDKLDLGREHSSRLTTLHRRWRILEDKAMGNLIEERLLRIEENGIVEDILQLLDHAEHPLPEPEEVAHAGAPAGATTESFGKASKTGTGDGSTTGSNAKTWLIAGGGLVILLLAFWFSRPDPESSPAATEVTAQPPTESPTPNESAKNPDPPTQSERPSLTLSEANQDRLQEAAGAQLQTRDLKVDPKILANRDILKAISPPLMTDGQKVPMTVAVYISDKAPTEYDIALTKHLGSFLRSRLQREISIEVLTNAFHSWEGREKLQLRGVADDTRLKATRTPHILMVDIRNIKYGKGEMRTCLYDVNRKKGFTRGGSIAIGTSTNPNENALLEPVLKYLVELKERGLFQ